LTKVLNNIKGIIEKDLRRRGSRKASDVLNMFDLEYKELVINIIKTMMADGDLYYEPPLKCGSIIHLNKPYQEIDENTLL
jgi:hypothetical protein